MCAKIQSTAVAACCGAVAALLAALLPPADARAADTSWNVNSGNWSTGTNWTAGEPTASDKAHVNNNGTLTINQSGEVCQFLYLGESAGDPGDNGTVQMTSGSLTVGQDEYIGDGGSGTFEQTGGVHNTGAPAIGGDAFLGSQAGSSGIYTLSGGSSVWNLTSELFVGDAGTGSLTVSSGGRLTSIGGHIGDESGTDGRYGKVTVTDDSSSWTISDVLFVGGGGRGELEINDGGSVSGVNAYVGDESGSQGKVTVHGIDFADRATFTTSNSLMIGFHGNGEIEVYDRARVSSADVLMAAHSGSEGVLTITGADTAWNNSDYFSAGGSHSTAGGTGTLTVKNQAALQVGGTLKVWDTSTVYLGTSAPSGGLIVAGSVELGTGAKFYSYGDSTLRTNGLSGFGSAASFDGSLEIGHRGGSGSGSYLRSSGETLSVVQNLTIGKDAAGSLTIQDGGTVTCWNSYIGLYDHRTGDYSGDGTVLVSGFDVSRTPSRFTVGNDLAVGVYGPGELTVENGAEVSSLDGYIGFGYAMPGDPSGRRAQGTVTVDGADSIWTINGWLYVGIYDEGELTISNGGRVLSKGEARIGTDNATYTTGTVTVDGLGSTWSSLGELNVGHNGTGVLQISNGGILDSPYSSIGERATSLGTATVDGPASTWDATYLNVGYWGTGELTISNGARVSAGAVNIGRYEGANGTVTVDGAGSTLDSTGLFVGGDSLGPGGTGKLTLSNGGVVNASGGIQVWDTGTIEQLKCELNTASLIVAPGGTFTHEAGTLTIDGGLLDLGTPSRVIGGHDPAHLPTVKLLEGATATFGGTLTVGQGYGGILETRSGSQLTTGWGLIGGFGSFDSRVTIDGAGSSWTNLNDLYVGQEGAGELSISDGGQVSNRNGFIAQNPSARGTAIVDGPGSTWTNSGSLYVGGSESAPGGIGELTVSNDAVLDVAGTLKIWDTGTLGLEGGTLTADVIDHSLGGAFSFTTGRLSVFALFGDLINDGGTIAPGSSPGITTIHGNLTMNSGVLEIDIGGIWPGNELDQLNVSGHAALGGALEVSLMDGYVPSLGDSFTILTFGSRTGDFDAYRGLDLGGGLRLQPALTADSLVLNTVPEPSTLVLLLFETIGVLVCGWRCLCQRLSLKRFRGSRGGL